ncbi:hypothetical protein [Deinococcus soli (ex Cha et al. 2016)]|uniref:Uncharacterized protein n=2 Tax=Deinococcus soli (ex Cha et al. 2016) TaxID=1309411 RepID=A0ACC6KFY8_9DEIO|nr:hypothetical protein [Deinococcus soli (ex Cha et al. 2016)]MDR6218358.1 hypothetical protein [Deinococcus soli (ex Cha et al. 2016)]MDR6329098.1 hypothetical protein [Deinococcus soli (ex Cha et al. 2016)]MDR6751371.1 hypothetical protein [Deinococcus soli (ex Cha et al. 2016)]
MDPHRLTPPPAGPHLVVGLPGSGLALLLPVSVPELQVWLRATHARTAAHLTAQLIPWTWPAGPRHDFGLTGTQLLREPPQLRGTAVTARLNPAQRAVTLDVPGRPYLRSAPLTVRAIRALMLAGLRDPSPAPSTPDPTLETP